MMGDDSERDGLGRTVLEAVLIAGLTTLINGFAEHVLERLRGKRSKKARKARNTKPPRT